MTPGDGSAAVPSEPRRWTIYVCPECNHRECHTGECEGTPWTGGLHKEARMVEVTVEEVGPVSEAEVEAGARALFDAMPGIGRWDSTPDAHPFYREAARAVLSAAREVKSDGD